MNNKIKRRILIFSIAVIIALLSYDRLIVVDWVDHYFVNLLINDGIEDLQPEVILYRSYPNMHAASIDLSMMKEKAYTNDFLKLFKEPQKKDGFYYLTIRRGGTSSGLYFPRTLYVDKSVILVFKFSNSRYIFFSKEISEAEDLMHLSIKGEKVIEKDGSGGVQKGSLGSNPDC